MWEQDKKHQKIFLPRESYKTMYTDNKINKQFINHKNKIYNLIKSQNYINFILIQFPLTLNLSMPQHSYFEKNIYKISPKRP